MRLDRFRGAITTLEGFEDGVWWVQDAAAAIPAKLFGDLHGKRVADLCAAPGGKTAQLVLAGGDVVAVEQSKSRVKRLESNLARLGLPAETRCVDLLTIGAEDSFDAILLDAPCSSTAPRAAIPMSCGPRMPPIIAKLAALQEKLLRHAVTLLKPGGRLVFSNCSIDPSEGEEIIDRLLVDFPDLRLLPIAPEDWPGLEAAITLKASSGPRPRCLPSKVASTVSTRRSLLKI